MRPSPRCVLAPLLLTLGPAAAAQSQLWTRQLGTDSRDHAFASAPDGSGGVYVGGETWGSLGGPSAGEGDAWLAQYDGAGNQLWIRQLGTNNSDATLAAAPDGSGGVYTSGYASGSLGGPFKGFHDPWLARYDGAGNQLWLRQFGTSSSDDAKAAAPDGSGGVYVGGETWGSLGGPAAGSADAWLAHYDAAGNQLWLRQLGTSGNDSAEAAAPDGSGGTYIGGQTRGSLGGPSAGSADAWLAHYDAAGNQRWILQLGTSGFDSAEAAAPDGSGGVYVGGETWGSLGGPWAGWRDAWLAHYDAAGNQLWIRQLGTSSQEAIHAAAPDGSGGAYVGGYTHGSLGGPNSAAGSGDAWLAHYDAAGNQLWIRQLGTSGQDATHAAAPDGSGGVYTSGATEGSLGGPLQGLSDAWLARYGEEIGAIYCGPASPNSSGWPGLITATGSEVVASNDVTLIAEQLPPGRLGYFLAGRTQGFFNPPGSQGSICLTGNIGRYNGIPDIIQGPAGSVQLDLTSIPVNPPQAVLPGDTWNFQCWYRDQNPGPTNNFTDAVSVTFQ